MTPPVSPGRHVVVIGAGPAGLTAAYELTKLGVSPTVVEKGLSVGGLARTETYRGLHFDIGGHRFFTKVEQVRKLWHEFLGHDFLRRSRLSRIYYDRKFFYYPLKPLNALAGLGLRQSILIGLSYLRWQLFPHRREETFEQWVTNRFGRRLFRVFFKTYTEKVWGISCSELRAEWAAQRIKGLSLTTLLCSMFVTPRRTIKTLIEEFDYPRLGPGMMWNAAKEQVERRGGRVRLGCDVVGIRRTGARIDTVRRFVDGLENLQTVGRNGLHRYNNQDHAMLTAIMAGRNLMHGEANDLWSVNTDQQYHEEVDLGAPARGDAIQTELGRPVPKGDGVAVGLATGLTGRRTAARRATRRGSAA